MGTTHRLSDAWKRWREKQRQYQIERAIFKQSGAEEELNRTSWGAKDDKPFDGSSPPQHDKLWDDQ